MKKFIFMILVTSLTFVFALGPPVSAATLSYNYYYNSTTEIAITDGAGTISPALNHMNVDFKSLTTSAYGTENATCMSGVSPVIKTSIHSVQSSFDNYTLINDAITDTGVAAYKLDIYSAANLSGHYYMNGYQPGVTNHYPSRSGLKYPLTSFYEGVTRAT
ncbi:MAG: hypothetical protein ABIH38_01065 [Patescibacteria group bacterium]